MKDLKSIVSSLKASYVVVVENDFSYEPVHVAMGKYSLLVKNKRDLIKAQLVKNGKEPLVHELVVFENNFDALPHTADRDHLLPDDLEHYLKTLKADHLLNDPEYVSISQQYEHADDISVREAFLRNGIFKPNTDRYDILLPALQQIEGVEIAFYRSMPLPGDLPDFAENLRLGLARTKSNFYIAIVDKMLGEGEEENGKQFVERDLMELNAANELKGLCFLFTSQANPSQPASLNLTSCVKSRKEVRT